MKKEHGKVLIEAIRNGGKHEQKMPTRKKHL